MMLPPAVWHLTFFVYYCSNDTSPSVLSTEVWMSGSGQNVGWKIKIIEVIPSTCIFFFVGCRLLAQGENGQYPKENAIS